MTRWVLFILIELSRRLRAYSLPGDGNLPPISHTSFPPFFSTLLTTTFQYIRRRSYYAAFGQKKGKKGEGRGKKRKKRKREQLAKGITLPSCGDMHRWNRTNRLDARTRRVSAACGTASIRTRDPWAFHSIVEPVLAWKPWPNSWPAIWQSRRLPSVTRILYCRECDPEVWATLSPLPDPMIDRPTDRSRAPPPRMPTSPFLPRILSSNPAISVVESRLIVWKRDTFLILVHILGWRTPGMTATGRALIKSWSWARRYFHISMTEDYPRDERDFLWTGMHNLVRFNH